MKQFRRFTALLIVLSFCFTATAFAHGGRTDSSGGHKDNKNASGLGAYHYHHGYEAHLHDGNVCPYDAPAPKTTPKQATPKKVAPTPAPKPVNMTSTTDINAYVNGQFVPSINYKNTTYVIAKDLESCGFDLGWDKDSRSLTISFSKDKATTPSTEENANLTYEVLDTDIKAYCIDPVTKEKKELSSYNIGGRTIVKLTELGSTRWDNTNRSCYLTPQ